MSTELGSEARRLIQAARGFDDANGADRDRLRERIATRLAAGGSASFESGRGPFANENGWLTRTFRSHTGGSHMGSKALGLVAATGAAVAVIAAWPSTKSLAPGEAIVLASPSAITSAATGSGRSPEVEVTPAPPQPLVRELEPGAATPVLETPSVPSHERPAAAHVARKAARVTSEASSADTHSSQLEQELKLLSAARDGLKSGDAALAMERVQEHERRYPAGILAMEARALGVDALCAAGRREAAREAAEAFLTRWPDSPLAARVRSACL